MFSASEIKELSTMNSICTFSKLSYLCHRQRAESANAGVTSMKYEYTQFTTCCQKSNVKRQSQQSESVGRRFSLDVCFIGADNIFDRGSADRAFAVATGDQIFATYVTDAHVTTLIKHRIGVVFKADETVRIIHRS